MINSYYKLDRSILHLIVAELFLQLINASFMQILLIYMEKTGYLDHESADYFSYRFLGVLLFSIPLGLIIKGRKIKPLFYIASLCTPAISLVVLYAIENHIVWLLYAGQLSWGLSFTCLQITVLPFILRNTPKENHTAAFSLSFATWSLASIITGIIIFGLRNIQPDYFDEKLILQLIVVLSFCSTWFVFKVNPEEHVPELERRRTDLTDFDWWLITKALVPTVIIATGAGLTIPYISLFFYKIHGIDSDGFAMLSAITTFLVFNAMLLVPMLKRRFGYKKAIITSQSTAVLALVFLATTEWYAQVPIALLIAIACFTLRQPLMNIAQPLTSDLIMKYVGKRNQEMVSALTAAIWSGSWFISSRIFKLLRETGFEYVNVFLITAGLYAIGVVWYFFLVTDYEKRQRLGLIGE